MCSDMKHHNKPVLALISNKNSVEATSRAQHMNEGQYSNKNCNGIVTNCQEKTKRKYLKIYP